MNIDIFYDTPNGIRLFRAIGELYYTEHGVYPKTMTELPDYINRIGYKCHPVNVKPPIVDFERCGITIDQETAIALLLKYT